MKITAQIKVRAKVEKVEYRDGKYLVSVKVEPTDGKANVAVVKALARHFKTTLSRVNIVSGFTSKIKRIEIL